MLQSLSPNQGFCDSGGLFLYFWFQVPAHQTSALTHSSHSLAVLSRSTRYGIQLFVLRSLSQKALPSNKLKEFIDNWGNIRLCVCVYRHLKYNIKNFYFYNYSGSLDISVFSQAQSPFASSFLFLTFVFILCADRWLPFFFFLVSF